jgi:ATP-dependent Lon protease
VLGIGGLKEKLLAAHRGGVKKVIIPHENLKDLHEIPKKVLEELTVVGVSHVDEVLLHALAWQEADALQSRLKEASDEVKALAAKPPAATEIPMRH